MGTITLLAQNIKKINSVIIVGYPIFVIFVKKLFVMAKLRFTGKELYRFFRMHTKIVLNLIPNDFVVVKHMKGSTDLPKGEYKSWSDWWNRRVKTPIGYEDEICPCCQRHIIPNKHNYFIIAHVIPKNNSNKICLLPVCNECNVKLKSFPFLAKKSWLEPMPNFD